MLDATPKHDSRTLQATVRTRWVLLHHNALEYSASCIRSTALLLGISAENNVDYLKFAYLMSNIEGIFHVAEYIAVMGSWLNGHW